MSKLSRRDVIVSAGLATAFGLTSRLAIDMPSALAQAPLEPAIGFKKYKVGDI